MASNADEEGGGVKTILHLAFFGLGSFSISVSVSLFLCLMHSLGRWAHGLWFLEVLTCAR